MSKRYNTCVAIPETFRIGTKERNGTGYPEVSLGFEVLSCDDEDRVGETIWYNQIIAPDFLPDSPEWVTSALRNAGMTNNDINAPEGLGSVKCVVVEQEREWEGKTYWNVRFVNTPRAKKKTLEPMEAAELNDIMAGFLADADPVEVTDENRLTAADEI